jgi:hypothetical protein
VRFQEDETELVILVTASLVEPMSSASVPPLPGVTFSRPDDWELYLEGRIQGREPAKLDPATMQWMKDKGLDQLTGPGAWDSYEDQPLVMPEIEPIEITRPSQEPEPTDETVANGPPAQPVEPQQPARATEPSDDDEPDRSRRLPWNQPTDLPSF